MGKSYWEIRDEHRKAEEKKDAWEKANGRKLEFPISCAWCDHKLCIYCPLAKGTIGLGFC